MTVDVDQVELRQILAVVGTTRNEWSERREFRPEGPEKVDPNLVSRLG
jgi:hypothetical protein